MIIGRDSCYASIALKEYSMLQCYQLKSVSDEEQVLELALELE